MATTQTQTQRYYQIVIQWKGQLPTTVSKKFSNEYDAFTSALTTVGKSDGLCVLRALLTFDDNVLVDVCEQN